MSYTDDIKNNEKGLSDIALVSYLVTKDFKILRITKKGEKAIFYFEPTPVLEGEILAYFNGEAIVNPAKFCETLRNLKSYSRAA